MGDDPKTRVRLTPGVAAGELTRQAIQVAYDLDALPANERDDFAREIAARARHWRRPRLYVASSDGFIVSCLRRGPR